MVGFVTFEIKNEINLNVNITQLHLLPMSPSAWET